jgi:hypothetical protein
VTDPHPEANPSGESRRRQALSKGLSEFLIEFSIGVHRYAMYPAGHPSLAPAVEGILRRLGPLFEDRRTLNIGVARRQLVIEGVATEERHPVLSELARRLHDLQVGAITFEAGAGGDEILGLLATLAREPEPDEEPIGLGDPAEIPSWPHVKLHPLGYERLSIREGEEEGGGGGHRATRLWLGLAQAALAGAEDDAEDDADPKVIAESIEQHSREAAYDQVIVGYMLQLAEELKSERGAESERVRQRLATLMREMDDATLARLVELGGDFGSRKRFVLDANQSLAVDAVVKVLQAAATASRQTVSTSMTRLLSKMARHAGDGAGRLRTHARAALQENVEELLDDWELADPNPEDYTRVLDRISGSSPLFDRSRHDPDAGDPEAEKTEDEDPAGALRLLQMAVEVEAYGPTVGAAILDLIRGGHTSTLTELARQAGSDNGVVQAVVRELTAPEQVQAYLALPDVDEEVLHALADFAGPSVIPLFLDGLAGAESRSVRRKIFDVTRTLGPAVGERALERLRGETRWFVIRNLLALLEFAPEAAARVDAMPYLQHEDPRVRREALPLVLADPGQRDRGLALGLADPDEQVCRAAVAALRHPVPDPLVPTILKRIVTRDREPTLRARAIRALTDARTPLVRDALLELVTEGRSLLGRARIAEPEPPVLAALRVLAVSWAEDPEVAPVLGQALKSKDPDIRQAAEGEGR